MFGSVAAALALGITGAAQAQNGSGAAAAHPIATIQTNKGTIRIRLYPEEAPKTVENFVKLAKRGFYNGLAWHRVIPGFVAQGGDPKGDGTAGRVTRSRTRPTKNCATTGAPSQWQTPAATPPVRSFTS
jgi:peptidyl-prolyl cis-trans isomerase B (cyclophilin B)